MDNHFYGACREKIFNFQKTINYRITRNLFHNKNAKDDYHFFSRPIQGLSAPKTFLCLLVQTVLRQCVSASVCFFLSKLGLFAAFWFLSLGHFSGEYFPSYFRNLQINGNFF
jgi:hypothetical protein